MSFAIRKAQEGLFTQMGIVETKPVTLNGQLLGHEEVYRPQFGGFKGNASRFDTREDAEAMIKDPRFGGETEGAFAGCTVEPFPT